MRAIQVSIDVFAAIWNAREGNEQSEEDILRRKFGLPVARQSPERDITAVIGYIDPKYNITLEPGFEIHRIYRRKMYKAQAIGGMWHLDSTGESYQSLNALSAAIGAPQENAWKVWRYKVGSNVYPMDNLRPADKIQKRTAILRRLPPIHLTPKPKPAGRAS